jgi:hypothetical protein
MADGQADSQPEEQEQMVTMWAADRRLYLDKDGNVVEADDPRRVQLLVPAGGTISLEQAQRLGLTAQADMSVATRKAETKRPNKARRAPTNKGRG